MIHLISFMADVALRSTLVLGVVFLVLALMRRASASERHLVLLLGLFVVALTPVGLLLSPKIVWTFDMPAQSEPAPPLPATVVTESAASPDTVIPNSSMAAVQPERVTWSFSDGLAVLLAAGMTAQILLLAKAARAWRKIRRNAVLANLPDAALDRARTFAGKRGVPPIFASDRIAVPLLAGWHRPEIILPSEAHSWPVARLAMVLCHEIAHFLRGDALLLPFGALMRVLYWWQPLVWLALARLRRERENACDDLVLEQNFRATDYAELIVETARQARADSAWPATALAMASSTNFSERIRAILDPAVRRKSAGRGAILTGIVVAVVLGWPLVATEIQAQEKPAATAPAASPSPPSNSSTSDHLVKIVGHFMEIDETTYKNDSDTIDTIVENGDISAALKLPGVSLCHIPQVTTRNEEQAVIEILREWTVQDPAGHADPKHYLGYRVVVKPSLSADGNISIHAFPEITEYQGTIQNQGVDQPIFTTRRVNLTFETKSGETKGFWLGDGYHLTEMMANNMPLKVSTGPPKRLAIFFTVSDVAPNGVETQSPSTKLEEKVKYTWIEKIDFKDAPIGDVLQFLASESKKSDPDHEGVNFVLRLSLKTPAPQPAPKFPVTLKMTHVPLSVVLDAIAAQTKLEYKIEDYAIYLRPSGSDAATLIARTFQHIPTGFFGAFRPGPLDPKTGDFVNDVKPELEAMGVTFSGDADARYLTLKDNALVVRNTQEQLDKIADLLATYVPTVNEVAYSFYMVEVDEKAYEQDKDAMNEAVEKGDIHYFDNKKTISVKTDRVVSPVGKAAWCSEGQQCQYVESVARVTKDGKAHTEINLANVFAGVNVDCSSSVTSFPGSSFGPPKGPIRLKSTVQVTEFVGADTLPLSRDIPPGEIPADDMPITPRYHVFTFNYNDWEPAAEKMHGRWADGVLDHDILDHPRDPQAFSSGRVYPKAPCRLAVFLGAEMVKVPVNTPDTGR